jgi:Flp pilus assembly protein TadD
MTSRRNDGKPAETGPLAVVIPFGVPVEGRGLGLGLAALVHSFAHIHGQSVALAQLLARKPEEGAPGGPVEAFVPPNAWRDLAGNGNAPPDVAVVITGAFEPPNDGRGMIQLLAFDAQDGKTRAKVELSLDGEHAGRTILAAFDEVWTCVGGDVGLVRDIGDLAWDALESVLRAERCALHDPVRGGPHDRLAAMMHLGRAVGDAPEARFPVGRLATFALEAAMSSSTDPKLADAALRALVRAGLDAPDRIELLEATAALHVRLGHSSSAEACAEAAVAMAPDRPRAYVILSEARRGRGDLDAALDAVNRGLARVDIASHPPEQASPEQRSRGDADVLVNERGVVLAERGDLAGAEAAWRQVLGRDPMNPAAFANLASVAVKRGDAVTAQALVDAALTSPAAHPDVLRRAINLALGTEADGVARAARLARLASMLVDRAPGDAWGRLMLARAHLQLGEKVAAKEGLARVESLAPGTALAAEAQRGRFALGDPQTALEIDSVLRAAYSAATTDLDSIATRARRLAMDHSVWTAWFAAGIAERRRERWAAAREAFQSTLKVAPGCTPAHMELAGALISLKEFAAGVEHAERACALEGPNPRALSVLATTLLAAGRRKDADVAITQALALDPNDAANVALAERIRRTTPPPGPFGRMRDALVQWGRRR